MTEAGLAAIEVAKTNGAWDQLNDSDALLIPDDLAAAFDPTRGRAPPLGRVPAQRSQADPVVDQQRETRRDARQADRGNRVLRGREHPRQPVASQDVTGQRRTGRTIASVPRRSDSLIRPLLVFAALALVALTVVAVTGALVVRKAATDQALEEARQLSDVSARLVERRVNDGLLTGDAETLGAVASVVFDAVKVEPIVRVKIWSPDGTIVYSDQTEFIGSTYELGDDELDVMVKAAWSSEVSDLRSRRTGSSALRRAPRGVHPHRHRSGRGRDPLVVRDLPAHSSITERRRELASTFLPSWWSR